MGAIVEFVVWVLKGAFTPKGVAWAVGATMVVGSATYTGWYVRGAKCDRAKALAVQVALERANQQHVEALERAKRQHVEDMKLLRESVAAEAHTRTVYVEITKEAGDVQVGDCVGVGDDWVRVYNDAVRAATPDHTYP